MPSKDEHAEIHRMPMLAEVYRRNIELGMCLMEVREYKGAPKNMYEDDIRAEATKLIKENLAKLRKLESV